MLIQRQNILDLIGKNKSKYSSCIITSYTFDFTFFEERILPTLRTSNIKNINVFVDGNYLDNCLEDSRGNEFKHHRTYSLNPIYIDGIFHPKIILLTGHKHGLLIIGSGNLTSSGISTNDEVWGAFHINSIDSPNVPLFAAVWEYFQPLFNDANGFNRQKINWIYHRAAWVNELPKLLNDSFVNINKQLEIAFVANTKTESIFNRLSSILPDTKLNELNIISPYFDENAGAIEVLKERFNPKVFNLITDSEFGLLPTKIDAKLKSQLNFFDWKDCLSDFDKRFNRLHAKIFQFIYEDGIEYLMIGSANATLAALGSQDKKPINAEAGIIIRRPSDKGYISELGIKVDENKLLDVYSYSRPKYNKGDSIKKGNRKCIITHTEINGNKLSVILIRKLEIDCTLNLLDHFDLLIESIKIESGEIQYNVETANAEKITKVVLVSKNKEISNYSLIHNVELLAKCNPDPSQIELINIIASLEENPEGDQYIELLRYADYNWVENELDVEKSKIIGSSNKKRKSTNNLSRKNITTEEFNSLDSIQQIEMRILNDPTTQVADILQVVSKGLVHSKNDVQESSEESLIIDDEEERTGTGDAAIEASYSKIRGEKIVNAINKHLDKVYNHYSKQLLEFKRKRNFQDTSKSQLTIKDCSHISIAVDLMYIFHGKEYKSYYTEFSIFFNKYIVDKIHELEKKYKLIRLDKSNPDFPTMVYYEVNQDWFKDLKASIQQMGNKLLIHQEEYVFNEYINYYLKDGTYTENNSHGIKGHLIETLGSFLLCANKKAGFKTYEYEVLNDKLLNMRKSLFDRASFLIANLHWNAKDSIYRMLLMLNLLQFIFPSDISAKEIEALKSSLEKQYLLAKKKNKSFTNNLSYFIEDLIPAYAKWRYSYEHNKDKLLTSVNELRFGDIIYNMKIGFCSVIKYNNEQLQIVGPGLDWDEFTKNASLKVNYYQSKIITF